MKEIIRGQGEELSCTVCGDASRKALTVDALGELLGPIIREHYEQGAEVRRWGESDNDRDDWWEQEGEDLSFVVQEVLGQYFEFEGEIVDAVVGSEDVRPQDGDVAFFDSSANYVESHCSPERYHREWNHVLHELKHKRRFFSSSAEALFKALFEGVDAMKAWDRETKKHESVVRELQQDMELFRARRCDSRAALNEAFTNPFKHVGPPPATRARAGRMNVEGVVVFYGAMDEETCLAETRPTLGGDSVMITLSTTKPLRLLDFTRLDRSYSTLSYFQPNFADEAEKGEFLRRLGGLISQPIIPGRESDYLITQTMAEYLAHVHEKPFDGILFKSVQRAGGVNVVLFPDPGSPDESVNNAFPLSYVDGSIKLFSTRSIQYQHTQRHAHLLDGEVSIYCDLFDEPDDL